MFAQTKKRILTQRNKVQITQEKYHFYNMKPQKKTITKVRLEAIRVRKANESNNK